MRLWHGVVLTAVVLASVAAFWLAREVSAQQSAQAGATIAAQPMPGWQPPAPGGPFVAPAQPPAPGSPVAAPAQPPAGPPPLAVPTPPFAPPPNVAITANSEFVYLVWGNMLLQFDARTLKLLRRVPLRGEFPREKPEKLVPPEKRQQKEERPGE